MCLRFNFTFQRLDKVELFTYSPDTGELVLWKLTKEDKHSIPEGVWMLGSLAWKKLQSEKNNLDNHKLVMASELEKKGA